MLYKRKKYINNLIRYASSGLIKSDYLQGLSTDAGGFYPQLLIYTGSMFCDKPSLFSS